MLPEERLFPLLRHAITGTPITEDVRSQCTPELLEEVYTLSSRHDLAHLIGWVVEKLNIPSCPAIEKFRSAKAKAVYRYLNLDHTLQQIYGCFSAAEIAFLPLKGSVIRDFYPEPWMRTSCDIDILIHKEDLPGAVQALRDKLGFTTMGKENFHDISLYSSTGVHLELHFSILEKRDNLDGLLARVWDFAKPAEGFRYAMTNEFFLFHQIAHMSYHFIGGGCGIRPLMDLYLLRKQLPYDETILRKYLAESDIERFYDHVLELIAVWFQGEAHTAITKQMEEYVLFGGVYGNQKQRIANLQKETGGKIGYLMSRLFLPLDSLKYRYPILKKYPILYPFCQIARWFSVFAAKRFRRVTSEIQTNRTLSKEESEETYAFLKRLGL